MVQLTFVLGALVAGLSISATAVTIPSTGQCQFSAVTTTVTSTSTVTITKATTTTSTRTVTATQGAVSASTKQTDGTSKTSSVDGGSVSSIKPSTVMIASSAILASTSKDKALKSSLAPGKSSIYIAESSYTSTSATEDRLIATPTTSKSIAVTPSTTGVSRPTARFTPSFSTNFVYDLDNQPLDAPIIKTNIGLALNKTMYIVDMANSTPEQIANYHAKGKKVGCYFSAGTWEPFRADKLQFLPECYCGKGVSTDANGKCTGKGAGNNLLGEWGEWWLDLRSTKCLDNVKSIMAKRIQEAALKGCDAIDPDNVDSFMNKQNFGNTAQNEVDYLLWLSTTAKANNMGIDLKNSGTLLTDPDTGKPTQWSDSLVKAFDFNVIESCHQYSECQTYDPFLKAGKPQVQIEYSNSIKKCPTLAAGQNLLVYSGTTVDSKKIALSCP
ncbi:hypothetical protein IAT40_004233 [Kwoniella sp. CBS 6097]